MRNTLKTEPETTEIGAKVQSCLKRGEVIYLKGDLGTGKTTLVIGALNKLGFVGNVKSPTYTIVEPYSIDNHIVYHFDLYRLNDPVELESLGVREYCDGESICFFEWPEKGGNLTPNADISLLLSYTEEARNSNLTAISEIGKSILATAF